MAGGGSTTLDRLLVALNLVVGFAILIHHPQPVDAAARLFHTRAANSKAQAFTEPAATDFSAPSPRLPPPGIMNATWENLYVVTEGTDGEIVQPGKNSTTESAVSFLSAVWGTCGTGNPMDDCWRCDKDWESHRQSLADCATGFGSGAVGGKNGQIYTVNSSADDDVANPQPGTLRHAVTREEPLWIIFATSMTIYLKNELIMTSYKTIDGRGANVHISGGAGLTIQGITNIIIEGVHIHDIISTGPARVMSSVTHVGDRGVADGDAISIYAASNIWIDHCYLSNAADGLIDAILGSTSITISNNYFANHNKVMLLGAHANDLMDKDMQVTIAFNTFGAGLTQRMPRCRLGYFQIVNNYYSTGWGIYAIGGSENPTILSEGNHFVASSRAPEVTKRINDGGSTYGGYQTWNWMSTGDLFDNGAFFTSSGDNSSTSSVYSKAYSLTARPAQYTQSLTADSGPLNCTVGATC